MPSVSAALSVMRVMCHCSVTVFGGEAPSAAETEKVFSPSASEAGALLQLVKPLPVAAAWPLTVRLATPLAASEAAPESRISPLMARPPAGVVKLINGGVASCVERSGAVQALVSPAARARAR